MAVIRLTPKELSRAHEWAVEHNRVVHDGKLELVAFAIRNFSGGGIGIRTVVTCEVCDLKRVRDSNDHEVTDWDAW